MKQKHPVKSVSGTSASSHGVTKAVIPAAGKGTRLLPLTKHLPKELLPVGGKPMIQHTIEMCVDSGISEICCITAPSKPLLEKFVTGSWTLPMLPFRRDDQFYGKLDGCHITFRSQPEPTGVADAVSLARDFVGNAPFVCIMPDCLLFSDTPFLRQLTTGFEKYRKSIIGTVFLRGTELNRFGNVGRLETDRLDDGFFSITSLSDKTRKPLATMLGQQIHKGFGGGIYLPEYFDLIDIVRDKACGEIDDVPIHHRLIEKQALIGVLLQGNAFDAGHPLGYRAAVHFAGRPAPGIHRGGANTLDA
jgi:UTP--glucose-1-phosphate uridylyltransferase